MPKLKGLENLQKSAKLQMTPKGTLLPIQELSVESQEDLSRPKFESHNPKIDTLDEPENEGGHKISFCESPQIPFYSIKDQDFLISPSFNNNLKETAINVLSGDNFKSTTSKS